MADKKITKAQMFTMIRSLAEVQAHKDMVDFIDHELELLNKKATNKKMTKTQEENIVLMDRIKAVLSVAEAPVTVTELISMDSQFTGLSTQKMTPLLHKLVDSGEVTLTTDKKKSLYFIAAGTPEN